MSREREKLRIALLYIIRETPHISFKEILRLAASGKGLPEIVHEETRHAWFRRDGESYIHQLIDMGFVSCDGSNSFSPTGKLALTPFYSMVQDYLSLNLTGFLAEPDDGIYVNPSFPKPHKSWQLTRIFVAMPFKAELKPIYTDHILKVANALGVSCKRADNFVGASRILHDVWSAIFYADILIVDCTGHNSNVFYELGIAHTLGKKCILITQSLQGFPFDVHDWRVIEYEYTPPGMAKFEETLTKTLQIELGLDG